MRRTTRFESYEVETVPGLEGYALREITEVCVRRVVARQTLEPGRILVDQIEAPERLLGMRAASAVYGRLFFPVARPTGLLGHRDFTTLVTHARSVVEREPIEAFETLSLSAAGRDSAVLKRLGDELCRALGLAKSESPGDLALTLKRAPAGSRGWIVLIRLTRRPLSTRPWRVCNMPGAINAVVAHVAAKLTKPNPSQRFLNLACGSSTILIERLQLGAARSAVGVDTDPDALVCSSKNLAASRLNRTVDLLRADATHLPFADASFDALSGDLPFGMLVRGGPDRNRFYLATLLEAARVAKPGALMSLITTNHSAIQYAIDLTEAHWRVGAAIPFSLSFHGGYIHPRIYVLSRSASSLPERDVRHRGKQAFVRRNALTENHRVPPDKLRDT